MKPTFVSVVVPAYNEAHSIQGNLDSIVRYLSARFQRFEVVVVNDGSTDGTQREIAEAASRDGHIEVVLLPANRGKGFAVRQGVLKAKGDTVLFTDADLSTPVEEIERAVEELSKGYSVVIASRQHPQSTIRVRQSWLRELMGKSFNVLIRTLFPLPYRDTQCGFKCFTQKAAREIFSVTRIDGFTFDVEVLLIAQRLGYSVKEIPVTWADVAESKVKLARGWVAIIRELSAILWNDRRGLYGRRPSMSLPDPQRKL